MINSFAAFGCSNRAIKSDNRAFHKYPLNNSSVLIVLKNLYIYIQSYFFVYIFVTLFTVYNI